VRVNRCFAVARADGAEAGLALLESEDERGVRGFPYYPLVRGSILAELGRIDEARASLEQAVERARNAEEAEQVRARIARLGTVANAGRPK
jgi:predicted RNA polymerase sigma factor